MAQPRITYRVGVDDQTKRPLDSINRRFQQTAKIAGAAFGASVTAGTVALTALTKAGLSSADALGKLSDQLGVAPAQLQALQRAAELTGSSAAGLNKALEKQAKNLGEARAGYGAALPYLKQLRLNNEQFFNLRPDEQFEIIASRVNDLATQQEKAAAANALFGREGGKLLNTLALGAEGLAGVRAEVDQYGLALSRIDIAKVEAANDSFSRAKDVVSGFGQQFAVQVSPILQAISDQFLQAAVDAGGVGQVSQKVFNAVIRGAGFAADAVNGLRVVYLGVKVVALSALTAPLVLVQELDNAITGLLNRIPGVSVTANEAIEGLTNRMLALTESARGALADALLAPPPSDRLNQFVESINFAATQAAEQTTAASAGRAAETADPAQQAAQLFNPDAGQVAIEQLTAFYERRFGIEEFYRRQDLDLTAQHERELSKITDAEEKKRIRARQSAERKKLQDNRKFLAQGFGALAQQSRKAFELQKAYRIAETVQNTYSAAVGAYNSLASIPYVGPALGAAAAAAAIAFGAAQINQIRSSSPGSSGVAGGGAPAGVGAGTAPAAPATTDPINLAEQTGGASNVINIDFGDKAYVSQESVRDFIENDFIPALADLEGAEIRVVAR